jgi:very-short-patch-repair endonuclease
MAAVLACAPNGLLSHRTAAALWGLRVGITDTGNEPIDVSVPAHRRLRCEGIRIHRVRRLDEADRAERDGIPVTSVIRTLIDLATVLSPFGLETAVNEADRLDLVDPEDVRAGADARAGLHGVPSLRAVLDRRTFKLTDSELERRFLRLVERAGLPRPLTQQRVNGLRVDFYWPELRLIVETDGLRYHRTPTQQSKDRARDQRHTAAGLTVLRFTHAQVVFEADRVIGTLRTVMARRRPTLWSS